MYRDETWTATRAAAAADGGASSVTDGGTDRGPTGEGVSTATTTEIPDEYGTDDVLRRAWSVGSLAEGDDRAGSALADRAAEIQRRERVVAVRHRSNQGAGGAIKTGYLAALVDGVDAVATIDGDGQMDPAVLSDLLDPIVEEDIDYAKGNRLLRREYRSEMPRLRLVGNFILTFLTKIASGYWRLMDPQNGYTVISREALEAVRVDELYEGYGYCNELLIKLNVVETRIADVPTDVEYSEEESHISYSSYVPRVSSLLLRGFLWRLKTKYLVLDFHPLVFCYLFGAGTVGLGALGGVYSLWSALTGTGAPVDGLLSPLLLVTGVAFLLFAMVLDRQANESLVRPQRLGSDSARME